MYLMAVAFIFFQAEDGIRDATVTGVQTCALPISEHGPILAVFREDRSVLGVFESNDAGPVAPHANRVHDDAHRNPDAARAVTPLAKIGRASCRERGGDSVTGGRV